MLHCVTLLKIMHGRSTPMNPFCSATNTVSWVCNAKGLHEVSGELGAFLGLITAGHANELMRTVTWGYLDVSGDARVATVCSSPAGSRQQSEPVSSSAILLPPYRV